MGGVGEKEKKEVKIAMAITYSGGQGSRGKELSRITQRK